MPDSSTKLTYDESLRAAQAKVGGRDAGLLHVPLDTYLSCMNLAGHTILVVDANPTPSTARLQAAIEHVGAQTRLARTAEAASEQVKRSRISAAVVKVEHRALAEQLGVSYVLYTPSSPPGSIIGALRRLLLGPCTSSPKHSETQ